jgi:hypothetical protein
MAEGQEWVDRSEANRIMQLLRQRGVPARCTVCDQADLKVMSYYVALVMTNTFKEDVPLDQGMGTACVGMVCPHCGYTRLHNLQELGVTSEP